LAKAAALLYRVLAVWSRIGRHRGEAGGLTNLDPAA
jgi:hypothetical protein